MEPGGCFLTIKEKYFYDFVKNKKRRILDNKKELYEELKSVFKKDLSDFADNNHYSPYNFEVCHFLSHETYDLDDEILLECLNRCREYSEIYTYSEMDKNEYEKLLDLCVYFQNILYYPNSGKYLFLYILISGVDIELELKNMDINNIKARIEKYNFLKNILLLLHQDMLTYDCSSERIIYEETLDRIVELNPECDVRDVENELKKLFERWKTSKEDEEQAPKASFDSKSPTTPPNFKQSQPGSSGALSFNNQFGANKNQISSIDTENTEFNEFKWIFGEQIFHELKHILKESKNLFMEELKPIRKLEEILKDMNSDVNENIDDSIESVLRKNQNNALKLFGFFDACLRSPYVLSSKIRRLFEEVIECLLKVTVNDGNTCLFLLNSFNSDLDQDVQGQKTYQFPLFIKLFNYFSMFSANFLIDAESMNNQNMHALLFKGAVFDDNLSKMVSDDILKYFRFRATREQIMESREFSNKVLKSLKLIILRDSEPIEKGLAFSILASQKFEKDTVLDDLLESVNNYENFKKDLTSDEQRKLCFIDGYLKYVRSSGVLKNKAKMLTLNRSIFDWFCTNLPNQEFLPKNELILYSNVLSNLYMIWNDYEEYSIIDQDFITKTIEVFMWKYGSIEALTGILRYLYSASMQKEFSELIKFNILFERKFLLKLFVCLLSKDIKLQKSSLDILRLFNGFSAAQILITNFNIDHVIEFLIKNERVDDDIKVNVIELLLCFDKDSIIFYFLLGYSVSNLPYSLKDGVRPTSMLYHIRDSLLKITSIKNSAYVHSLLKLTTVLLDSYFTKGLLLQLFDNVFKSDEFFNSLLLSDSRPSYIMDLTLRVLSTCVAEYSHSKSFMSSHQDVMNMYLEIFFEFCSWIFDEDNIEIVIQISESLFYFISSFHIYISRYYSLYANANIDYKISELASSLNDQILTMVNNKVNNCNGLKHLYNSFVLLVDLLKLYKVKIQSKICCDAIKILLFISGFQYESKSEMHVLLYTIIMLFEDESQNNTHRNIFFKIKNNFSRLLDILSKDIFYRTIAILPSYACLVSGFILRICNKQSDDNKFKQVIQTFITNIIYSIDNDWKTMSVNPAFNVSVINSKCHLLIRYLETYSDWELFKNAFVINRFSNVEFWENLVVSLHNIESFLSREIIKTAIRIIHIYSTLLFKENNNRLLNKQIIDFFSRFLKVFLGIMKLFSSQIQRRMKFDDLYIHFFQNFFIFISLLPVLGREPNVNFMDEDVNELDRAEVIDFYNSIRDIFFKTISYSNRDLQGSIVILAYKLFSTKNITTHFIQHINDSHISILQDFIKKQINSDHVFSDPFNNIYELIIIYWRILQTIKSNPGFEKNKYLHFIIDLESNNNNKKFTDPIIISELRATCES